MVAVGHMVTPVSEPHWIMIDSRKRLFSTERFSNSLNIVNIIVNNLLRELLSRKLISRLSGTFLIYFEIF